MVFKLLKLQFTLPLFLIFVASCSFKNDPSDATASIDTIDLEEIKERALLHNGLKHYFIIRFPQRAGALKEFVAEVLGPNDDISHFEYTKKNNREKGPALVGIELQSPDDFDGLICRLQEHHIPYEVLNENFDLFHFLV